MKRKTKYIIYNLVLFIIILTTCFNNSMTDKEKIKMFFKYDEMFFFGHKDKNFNVENGSVDEIIDIKDINDNYKTIVNNYLNTISNFISENFDLIKNYYKEVTDDKAGGDNFNNIDSELTNKLKNNLLNNLPSAIRCMFSVFDIQYIEVAIKIDEKTYANTLDLELNTIDNVYWTAYLIGGQPTKLPRAEVIDEQGAIKYPEWFYESNMKIRIVKQIRDKDGKYYGEIYADYYKLDQYDNLFDKNGNPKKVNVKK